MDHNVVIDTEWWNEQFRRSMNGIYIPDAIKKGGNAYIDEQDVFWNDSLSHSRILDDYDNYEIPPNSCYIPQYDLLIKDKILHITGRQYFYLNFWPIFRNRDDVARKDILPPKFIDIDYFFFRRMEMMTEQEKDDLEMKCRQIGISEKFALMLGFNFTFFRASVNIVVGGQSDDADHTMENVQRGLRYLINTQFYKERDKSTSGFWRAKHFRSELRALSARDNVQIVSRFSPTLLVCEEIGKWKKGSLKELKQYVDVSTQAENKKTGYILLGGCVCAGTKVWTANGELCNIEDLKKNDGILGYNGKGVEKEVIKWTKPPQKKHCYRIETSGGNFIECSFDHPLLTSRRKWSTGNVNNKRQIVTFTEAAKIKKGEYIFMADYVSVFGDKSVKSARLLGLMIGDGNYSKGVTPSLSCGDDDIRDYVINLGCNFYENKEYIQSNGKKFSEIRIREFKEELINAGIYGQVKGKKRLPDDIHEYDKQSLAELIGGYYDADGNVNYSEKKNTIRVVLTSVVFELLEQVKYQLMKFGINSSIIKENRNGESPPSYEGQKDYIYRLYVTRQEDVTRFKNSISFLCNHKQKTLNFIDKIKKSRKQGRLGLSKFEINKDNNKGQFFVGKDNLSNLRYETVKSVTYIGEQYIYNLHTAYSNTYLSNGFITKQTGGDMLMGADDAEKMAYDPDSVNVLSFRNKFDKDNTIFEKVGHFISSKYFRIIDEDGNSDTVAGEKAVLEERAKLKGKDKYTHTTQRALYLGDAFMVNTGGFFGEDVAMWCNHRISYIRSHSEEQIIEKGHLRWKDRKNKWKGVYFEANEDGPFKILEHPILDVDNKPYINLYVAGTDSYDQDESYTTTSQGACVVKKRFLNADTLYNTYVAMLLERPETSIGGKDLFYEHTALLTMYYNAKNLIEWSKIFIFEWYARNGVESLLKERPEFVLSKLINKSQATNFYGIDPSTKLSWLKLMSEYVKIEENIVKSYFIEMLSSWAKYKYIPGKSGGKLNDDLIIAMSLCETFEEDIREMEVISESSLEEDDPMPVYVMDGEAIIQQW